MSDRFALSPHCTSHPVNLDALLTQFYAPGDRDSIGVFREVESLPDPLSGLLDHEHHMTVTVETYHGGPVDVEVLRAARSGDWYSREILLRRSRDHAVVQYGIVRMLTTAVRPEVWARIESKTVPLGRVLIEHGVLRQVQLCRLWNIEPGPKLASFLDLDPQTPVAGRTALIHCNHQPAIELLEVVRP